MNTTHRWRKKIILILVAFWVSTIIGVSVGFAKTTVSENGAYQQAVALFNQMQWSAAQKAFEKFKHDYPKSRWNHAVLLRLADIEKDSEKAVKLYKQVLAGNPESEWRVDARWGLAMTAFVQGSYTQAASLFDQVTPQSGQRHAQALYLAGLAYLALKQYPIASERFQKTLNQYSGTRWAQLALPGLGESEMNAGQLTASINALDRYLREFPEGDATSHVLMLKAKAVTAQGRQEEATQLFHELVTRYSESYEAEKAKGKLVKRQDKYTIQVGAFSQKMYAEKLVRKLRKKGFNAYVLEAKHGTEIFNQVRIGSYTTRAFSEKIAKKIEQSEQLPYIILPYVKPGLMEPFENKK